MRGRDGLRLEDIAKVDIGMYEVGVRGHDHRHAYNLLDAQMSAPVSTALALVYGDVTATTYEMASLYELFHTSALQLTVRAIPL